ncbi:hypothetical protein BGE01nite_35320 [Brevifollis gellanilyticus]|uniref:Uncharacterized protein n=1 Tax=Brevifollis gellanilyticus TaxID=748831 RepID=A0A512MCZ7_9BACT|nr:hypothetical protein BGE01nite_35320 [Brevifollis gellanilyticus]
MLKASHILSGVDEARVPLPLCHTHSGTLRDFGYFTLNLSGTSSCTALAMISSMPEAKRVGRP